MNGQTEPITIESCVTHEMSGYIIGVCRNHVQEQTEPPTSPNNFNDYLFNQKLALYGNITPSYGNGRKLYRFGGSMVDGVPGAPWGLSGWHYPVPTGTTGPYPYDDFTFYLNEATAMNADLLIGINVGSGTPGEAAQLVKDLIASGDIQRVALFEMGNELSGFWQEGHQCSPQEYIEKVTPFINAMVNAALQEGHNEELPIGLMGSYDMAWAWNTYNCPNPTPPPTWAEEINAYLNAYDNGLHFNFICFHPYIFHNLAGLNQEESNAPLNCDDGQTMTNERGVKSLMALNHWGINNRITQIQQMIGNRPIRLANTEYNTHVHTDLRSGIAHSIVQALFTADNMMTAIKRDIPIANNYSFFMVSYGNDNTFSLMFEPNQMPGGSVTPYPVFYVHRMIAENLGQVVLEDIDDGQAFGTLSVEGCGDGSSYEYPKLSYVSTMDVNTLNNIPDGTISTLVINRTFGNEAETIHIDFNMPGYTAQIMSIVGESIDDETPQFTGNNSDGPEFVDVANIHDVPFKPLSINIIRFVPDNPLDLEFTFSDMGCLKASFMAASDNPTTYSYSWDYGDGKTGSGTNTIHTYDNPGTYNVTMTIQVAPNCVVTHSQEVTVSPIDPLNTSFTYAIDCPDVAFTAPTGNPAGTTYAWDFGDGSTSTDINPSHVYAANGTYTVSLTVTDGCGNSVKGTNSIEVNCFPNFVCPCTGNNSINIDAGDGTLLSTIQQLAGTTLFNSCLAINGKLIVDKDYNIYYGELRMQPGSEIAIRSGSNLMLIAVSSNEGIHGCEQMWKGITVENGASLQIWYSTIKDAQYAVKALNNSKLGLWSNMFDRNYVGVYVPAATGVGFGQQVINQFFPMGKNTFTCDGSNCNLLPGYPGQYPSPGNIPHAGIEINNAQIVSIGRDKLPYTANFFRNLHNGIIANSSLVASYYSDISDMKPSNSTMDGCGVKSTKSFVASIYSKINKARCGIYSLSDYFLAVLNSSISNCHIGVQNYGAWYSPRIENNKITNISFGIILGFPKYQISSSIIGNDLNVANSGTGISFNGLPFGKKLSYNKIVQNNIFSDSIGTGIYITSSGKLGIQDNSIFFSKVNHNIENNGIQIKNSRYNYIYGNTISQNMQNWSMFKGNGISLFNSPNNTICTNLIDGWYSGLKAIGGSANTEFKFNVLKNNNIGVLLGISSIIGKQIHHQNNWMGGNASALHQDANKGIRSASQFIIDTCALPWWPAIIYPQQGCQTSTSDDWFFKDEKDPFLFVFCDSIFHFHDFIPSEKRITQNDINLVKGVFKNTQFGESLDWEQNRYLFRKMYNQNNLIGANYQTDEFYYNNMDSPLGELVEIEEMINEAYSLPYNFYPNWGELADTIVSILHEIGEIDAQLDSVTNNQDSSILASNRNALLAHVGAIAHDLSTQASNMDSLKVSLIVELAEKNAAILPQTKIQELEKALNTIYFNIVSGKTELDSVNQEIVRDIAERCPMQYGHVVLKARSIRRLFEQMPNYDDDLLCAEAKSRSSRLDVLETDGVNFIIQPNPVSDLLQIKWDRQPSRCKKVRFELRKLDGHLVAVWILDNTESERYLDVSSIQSGFYVGRIFVGDDVGIQKVIVLH